MCQFALCVRYIELRRTAGYDTDLGVYVEENGQRIAQSDPLRVRLRCFLGLGNFEVMCVMRVV
jgi:hypothetical protein